MHNRQRSFNSRTSKQHSKGKGLDVGETMDINPVEIKPPVLEVAVRCRSTLETLPEILSI
jgi:hypothetical protein